MDFMTAMLMGIGAAAIIGVIVAIFVAIRVLTEGIDE